MADETPQKAAEKVEGSRTEQHPALAGDVAGEVAARSADGSDGTTFRKVFVLAGDFPKGDHPQHDANCLGVLQEALHRGLHPKGQPTLTAVTTTVPNRRGQVSTYCTYEVPVVPAVIDDEAHTTVSPSSSVAYEPVRS
jgi:hypothetical protein